MILEPLEPLTAELVAAEVEDCRAAALELALAAAILTDRLETIVGHLYGHSQDVTETEDIAA